MKANESAIAIFRQIGHKTHLVMTLGNYALAASRRYLYRSLQISSASLMYDHSLVALYCLAHPLLAESQTIQIVSERQEYQWQALALFSLVNPGATVWQLFHERRSRPSEPSRRGR